MLNLPKPREKAGSFISIAIPEFDVNALPIRRTINLGDSHQQQSVEDSSSSVYESLSETGTNSFSSALSSGSAPLKSKSFINPAQQGQQDKAVLEFMSTLSRTSQVQALESSSKVNTNYDARMTVAVIGSDNSGKEVIISKELGLVDNIPVIERSIAIMSKIYSGGGRLSTLVEYWLGPDSKSFMTKSAKCLTGHAGTIFVFDVTEPNSLIYLLPWIEVIKSTMANSETPYGYFGILMANKIDQPGLRVIFEEEGAAFAKQHNLEYMETCPSEEVKKVRAMFTKIVTKAIIQIPDSMNRTSRELGVGRGTTPIGLQLGLALDPWSKFKYKERLKREKRVPEVTKSCDWLTILKKMDIDEEARPRSIVNSTKGSINSMNASPPKSMGNSQKSSINNMSIPSPKVMGNSQKSSTNISFANS